MNDLLIKVSKRSRLIDLDHSTLGIVGENLQEKLIFTFQDEFVDGMARLEYELDNEKHYVLMDKVGQSYILPVQNVLLSKEGNIDLQLVITEDKTGTPVFKSEVFTLYCKKSIEAVGEAPSSYELWIEKANRILLEASRVNIDGKKTGNETLITITQRDGNKKNFSILDGQDGQDGQDGNGIVSIEKTSTSTLVDTYTITFTDGTTTTFEVTNGNGIVSIEKTSTSGLVDTYTITFSDGTTTTYTVTNGETQDLSNYVQKTEFNESQAEQDTTTRELQAELDRYKLLENALPHTENETASDYVTLENTAKSPMEVSLTPQTSQETTTGKNLFNKYSSSNTGTSGLEKTVLNADGQIVSTSNYGTNRSKGFTIENLEQNTDYILSGELISANGTNQRNALVQILSFTNSTIKSNYFESSITKPYSFDFTFNTGENSSVWISFNGWGLLQDSSLPTTIFDNIQIEKGNSATSYEPYTGEIPAPNPDYPEDIHCTTGENQVKVINANLLNIDNSEEGGIDASGTEVSGDTLWRGNEFIKVLPSTDYTFSSNKSMTLRLYQYDENYNFIPPREEARSNTFLTITTGLSTRYLKFSIYDNGTHFTKELVETYNLQIEQSSSASSYTPHEETTYPISLGNKEMFNINGVYDGFVYDETTDKFYINRKIGKVVLNGSEDNWEKFADGVFRLPIANAKEYNWNVLGAIKSDKYIAITQQQAQGTDYDYGISLRTSNTGIVIRNKDYTTTADFKTYLSTNNTTVVYQLATSTLEEITDTTLISQLRAIKDALSMQGTTHIISTASGSNLPFLIKARAVQTIERT